MLHLGYLNYTQYQVQVSFKGLENITYDITIKFVVSDKAFFFRLVKTVLFVLLWFFFFVKGFFFTVFVSLYVSVENIQPYLFTRGDLVPLCVCGVDLYGDGKNCFGFFLDHSHS